MNGFQRKNQLLSLCGLNCGLCPMLLGNHCGGCGNGNQSCKIAKCRYVAEVFQKIADRRNIKLKLMKKSSNINLPQTAEEVPYSRLG